MKKKKKIESNLFHLEFITLLLTILFAIHRMSAISSCHCCHWSCVCVCMCVLIVNSIKPHSIIPEVSTILFGTIFSPVKKKAVILFCSQSECRSTDFGATQLDIFNVFTLFVCCERHIIFHCLTEIRN